MRASVRRLELGEGEQTVCAGEASSKFEPAAVHVPGCTGQLSTISSSGSRFLGAESRSATSSGTTS